MKGPRQLSILLSGVALAAAAVACGPMNKQKPDAQGTSPGISRSSGIHGEHVATTKNGDFMIFVGPQDVTKPFAVGDNAASVRVIHADSLLPLANDAQVSIQYHRVNSRLAAPSDATATRGDDGSFQSTLTFKKAGAWEVTVHAKEGSREDDLVLEITI